MATQFKLKLPAIKQKMHQFTDIRIDHSLSKHLWKEWILRNSDLWSINHPISSNETSSQVYYNFLSIKYSVNIL